MATSLRILRGRRGTYDHLWHWAGFGGALGSQLTPWTPRLFVWQAWHLATSTCILCGRRGRCAFCVAGVALMARGWLWWRAWVGRRGTWRHRPPWHLAASTFTLCGRRGGYGTGLALVAFVTHNSFTHNFVAHFFHTQLCHTFLSHTTLAHISFTQLFHTQLCHTQLFHTRNFVTHNSFTHNSFTHNFVTYTSFTHNLLHTTLSHTSRCPHTALLHTQTYTLAQNCHVEFCCGMHLTCKSTPIIPDRNGSVKRPERKSRGHHRHSQCKMKGV